MAQIQTKKPMVQIQTPKNNGSNPDNTQNQLFKARQQNQWFKSGQQKTIFQIQKTINNGSNPDNKKQTKLVQDFIETRSGCT